MCVTLNCTNTPVVRWNKVSSDGGDSGSKECTWGYGGAYSGVWNMESGGLFFVLVPLAGIWIESPWKCVHTECTSYRNFINFVLSVRVYKDNAATNCTKKVYSHQLLLYNNISYMRFQVLTTASMKMIVFSEVGRRFRGASWWWRQYAPLTRRSTSTKLHGCTSQKAIIVIFRVG
jgi:hypothetical protein